MFALPSPKQKPDPKTLLPKTQMRVKKKNKKKNALKSAVAACSWREGIGHVNLSHSAMAQAATSHHGQAWDGCGFSLFSCSDCEAAALVARLAMA
jgi:hypothetical protein